MAYKIEAHIVEEGTEEIRTTVTFWGEDKSDAEDAYEEALNAWPGFAAAEEADRLIIEEGECDPEELPSIEAEEEEEEANPRAKA